MLTDLLLWWCRFTGYFQMHDHLHLSYVCMYLYKNLFLDLGEKFYAQTSSFTAGPIQPVSWLISHVLLRSCYPSSSSLSSYHSASVSSRQLGTLTTTFETIADLESIDGEATKREDINAAYSYSNPRTLCIGHWSTLHLENCLFSSAFPPLINHFCWPTMKELESFSLGDSWSIEMVTVSLLLKAKYRYDNRQIYQIGLYIWAQSLSYLVSFLHQFSSFLLEQNPWAQPVRFNHKELLTTWDYCILNFNHAAFTPLASRFRHRHSACRIPRRRLRGVGESLLWWPEFAGWRTQAGRYWWRCKDWLHSV